MQKNQIVALVLALVAAAGTTVNLFRRSDVDARTAASPAGGENAGHRDAAAPASSETAEAELKRLRLRSRP